MATWIPSPNFNTRLPVLIVIHFTDQASVQASLDTLRDASSPGPVSAHYLIGSDGHIYQLVAEGQRAWHAGAGRWGTITDVNSASIGIELDNDGHTPFANEQIDSLIGLLDDLTRRLRIPRTQIVGHEDIAPTRKNDPGPLFPWERLAQAGFGRWPPHPLPTPPATFDGWMALGALGYALDNPGAALHAFRHHFRGIESDAPMDDDDRRILYALNPPAAVPQRPTGP